jgi:hypothetical protein
MKTILIIIGGIILTSTGLFAEPQKSLIVKSGTESELPISDPSSTNETLYSRLKGGELIYWQYGTTNLTAVVATGSVSTTKKQVPIVEFTPVRKKIIPPFDPELIRAECFKPAARSSSGPWYTPHSITKQWASAWTTGTEAPTGALVWKNF